MACRRVLPLLAVAALLAVTGCSKTQDTAADPMRFGLPPVIESVNQGRVSPTNERTVSCEFTDPFDIFLYNDGPFEDYCDLTDLHPSGRHQGYPIRKTRRVATYGLAEGVTQVIGGTYTETRFEVVVTDPDSNEEKGDNVNLVTASFVLNAGTSSATEISMVVMDDGSENIFTYDQSSSVFQANCDKDDVLGPRITTCKDVLVDFDEEGPICPPLDPQYADSSLQACINDVSPTPEVCTPCVYEDGSCDILGRTTVCLYCQTTQTTTHVETCAQAQYQMMTNDDVKGDHLFTRGFAFFNLAVSHQAGQLMQDCIAKVAHQAPFTAAGVQNVEFKIEAIDKQANLAEWGQKLIATINPNTFDCSGDECLCCFIRNGQFGGPCERLPGVYAPEDPSGKCNTADNPTPQRPPGFYDDPAGTGCFALGAP